MTASFATWTVLPHEPLQQLEDNLWRVEGTLPKMPLHRVMTVVRLASGELVVHNPIALSDPEMAKLDALGKVAFLVVPNGWHRQDLKAFHARYPAARVLAPAGARKKVAEVEPTVEELRDLGPDVALAPIDGTKRMEAVMTVRSGDRISVVLADAVFNMPHLTGVQGFVLKHITGSSGGPKTSRIARVLMIKDKAAFAAHLERLATPDLARVIVAHHQVIDQDPAGTLKRIAATLR